MKNLLDLNKAINQILSDNPLVNQVTYGEKNRINWPTDFMPIQVAFQVTGLSGLSESVESYDYSVLILDKIAEDLSDIEGVHSKCAEVCNDLVSKLNRSEDYKVLSSSATLIEMEYNDQLSGFELNLSISVHNSENIC